MFEYCSEQIPIPESRVDSTHSFLFTIENRTKQPYAICSFFIRECPAARYLTSESLSDVERFSSRSAGSDCRCFQILLHHLKKQNMQQRYVLSLMGFGAIVCAYTMRVCLNMAITEMTSEVRTHFKT